MGGAAGGEGANPHPPNPSTLHNSLSMHNSQVHKELLCHHLRTMTTTAAVTVIIYYLLTAPIHCFIVPNIKASLRRADFDSSNLPAHKVIDTDLSTSSTNDEIVIDEIFDRFAAFLKSHQPRMIDEIEHIDGSGESFSHDGWGSFADNSNDDDSLSSGGITRVLQNGSVVEKGACSLTIIRNGKLTKERAEAISGRQEGLEVDEGDVFSAAALSVVLHTRNPFVPVSFGIRIKIIHVMRLLSLMHDTSLIHMNIPFCLLCHIKQIL